MKTFYTPKDISTILDISYQNALEFIKYSGITYLKIGRQYRVNTDIFNKYIKNTNIVKRP